MKSREEMAQRITQLERELAMTKGGGFQPVRKRSQSSLGDWPLYDIAIGPDLQRGEVRGHARGIIALGDMATGFLAIGGLARGVIALGGLAAGLFSFGGRSVGVLAAFGGLAVGGLAVGGAAVGGVAVGGGAAGYYACGGAAVGQYVMWAAKQDPEAVAFFEKYGLDVLVQGPGR